MEKRQSTGTTKLHPKSLHKTSSVTSKDDHSSTHIQLSQSNVSLISLDYSNGIFKGSDCIINDVVEGDASSLNPSLMQDVNQQNGKISGLNKCNGNIHSGECSFSLSFSQTSGQTVSQEKTVHFISPKNTIEMDTKNVIGQALVGGTGLQGYKELDDMDDFDIDDLSENDIPDYCEQPAAVSVSGSSSIIPQPFCEGGLSNSCDKKNVATPTAVVKTTKPCFPG